MSPKQQVLRQFPTAQCRNGANNGNGAWHVETGNWRDFNHVDYKETPQQAWKAAALAMKPRTKPCVSPLTVACPLCKMPRGEGCVTYYARRTTPHAARIRAAQKGGR